MSFSPVSYRVCSFTISALLCTFLLSVVSSPQAEAQLINQRVRVSQNSGIDITGRVTERSDSLFVIWDEMSGEYYQISYIDVRTLSVSQGVRSYAKTGLIAGGVTGASVFVLSCEGCSDNPRAYAAGIIMSSALMAWIGVRAGRLIQREHWTAIPVPGRTALRFEPLLGVSLAARPVFGVRLKL